MTPQQISRLANQFLPSALDRFLRAYAHRLGRRSFSQEGEDLILARMFEKVTAGFYVDVGAHHPFRFSNTYLFYRRGWKGINIDAMPGAMDLFKKFRPRDINLELGVGSVPGDLSFHIFNEPAVNTFDNELAQQRNRPPYRLLRTAKVEVRQLRDILNEHVLAGQKIDFMSVDVEGADMDVLLSNDWSRHRPRVVIVETMSEDIADLFNCPASVFMKDMGYKPISKSVHSAFFQSEK